MFYYNWVIPGDMFRPLNGHLKANLNNIVKVQSELLSNRIPLDNNSDCTLTILLYVGLKMAV